MRTLLTIVGMIGEANGVVDRIIGGWQIGVTSIIRSGQLVDLGNVRLVGMDRSDVEKMFKLRFDDAGRTVWMMPQDVIDNTIKAFSVSATSPTGYSTQGVPAGRYFAPATGPDCIEVDNGGDYGDCGTRSLVVIGPMFQPHDTGSRSGRRSSAASTSSSRRSSSMRSITRMSFRLAGLATTSPTTRSPA